MRLGKSPIRRLRIHFLFICAVLLASAFSDEIKSWTASTHPNFQAPKRSEHERERAYNQQLFKQSFQNLQILGQNLLKDHDAGHLTSGRLAKDAKSINKCAKALRSLTALGDLAVPTIINKDINTARKYDESIRLLAKHIWDFAHNPVHQNTKIFNTDEAARAQTDLLAIIDLSKAIESKAKGYVTASTLSQ